MNMVSNAAASSSSRIADGVLRRRRVLIVDNDPTISRVVVRILAGEHETHTCTVAREAIALLASGSRFDVILCDFLMPELSGNDFFRAVSSIDPAIAARIVFITGAASLPEVQAFLSSISNVVLEKPFTRVALRDTVRSVAGGVVVQKD